MNDPRHGVPSCSAFPRLDPQTGCPASFAIGKEAEARGAVPPSGEDADSGTRIHAIAAGGNTDASMGEHDIASRCLDQAWRLAEDFFGLTREEIQQSPDFEVTTEVRLGMTPLKTVIAVSPETRSRLLFTGQYDLLIRHLPSSRALLVDYKSGRGEVEEAEGNRQLMGLAALVAGKHALTALRAVIVQPLSGQPKAADYDRSALTAATEWAVWMVGELAREWKPKTGAYCVYCPGRIICPAINGERLAAIECIAPHTLPAEGGSKAAFARVAEFSGEDLAAILDDPRFKMAGWIMEAARALVAKRIADGQLVPGYELREVEGKRTVSDPRAAYEALGTLKPEEFFSACSVSLPKLEEIVRVASGQKVNKDGSTSAARYNLSGVQAKALVNEKCAAVISRKKSMRLAKIGVAIEEGEGNEA